MHEFDDVDEDAPLLRIGPAAELAGMHPQTLRQYDRLGLVVPGRTPGGSRRYSLRNIRQLRQVQELSNDGISLPAIERILDLEDEVAELRHQVVQLQTELQAERENRPGSRVFAAETSGAVVRLQPGTTRVRRRTEVVLWRPHP
ncbi:heat shock protein transcriptional repressor HspR [Microbacterium halophytorum]|uniref:heat shock protein transcriptional repressor HspR n=1 Tax=Microbacterium halophytorum TaxID=2067568 RepID=UPI000CFD3AB5|nr:MerR family transcriptional regulator [Microbacterium halophytorum]